MQFRTNPHIPNDRRVRYLHLQINIQKENHNSQRRIKISFYTGYDHLKNYKCYFFFNPAGKKNAI